MKIVCLMVGLAICGALIFAERDQSFAGFRMEHSDNWNAGIPFNYFLVDEKDGSIVSFLVNAYLEQDGFLYFSEIDGYLQNDFCYQSKDLKLSKIDLNNRTMVRFIPIDHKNIEIFKQIHSIKESDAAWLERSANRC